MKRRAATTTQGLPGSAMGEFAGDLEYAVGYYAMKFSIGTPPVERLAAVDTMRAVSGLVLPAENAFVRPVNELVLHEANIGRFMYCLPWYLDANVSSHIAFDSDAVIADPDGVVSTPIADTKYGYYWITLENFSVGGKTVLSKPLNRSTGGMVVDSGSTLTYLPNELHDALINELRSVVKSTPVSDPTGGTYYKLCYNASDIAAEVFPTVAAHFAGGAVVQLSPKALLNFYSIEKLMNSFWWGGKGQNSKGIHWMSWTRMAVPKNFGGLGFKQVRAFNVAMLGKQGWRFLTRPEALVSRVFKARVGNGRDTLIWGSPWLNDSQQPCILTERPPFMPNLPVEFLIESGSGHWKEEVVREWFLPVDVQRILALPLGTISDDNWY
ncbi:unnamed protein product [Cuscuta campestris]|uniref:Xylanase inhibitor C-terminal domain-containing protein n=1 Tax=Cuscuta campestris TaxID=132261 RepID=A0A484LX82_9ASTE|nr:unnamed protein product [Cuscuta campestris]